MRMPNSPRSARMQVPQGDGTYRLFGSKALITYGEHDYAKRDNGVCL